MLKIVIIIKIIFITIVEYYKKKCLLRIEIKIITSVNTYDVENVDSCQIFNHQ